MKNYDAFEPPFFFKEGRAILWGNFSVAGPSGYQARYPKPQIGPSRV